MSVKTINQTIEQDLVNPNYEIYAGTLFEDFNSLTGWTTSPNNPSQLILETSDIKEGTGSFKLISTSSSNNQQAIFTIDKTFTDSDGRISFWVKPTSNVNYIVLGFSSATSFASVYMNYQLSSTNMFADKWNFVRIKLSDFTAVGGDSFSNKMIRMRLRVVSNNASPANAIFDDLRLGSWTKPKILLQSDNAGSMSTIEKIYPILEAAGYKATLYVQSNLIGQANKLSLSNLQTLYNSGWDLCNHTTDHSNLTELDITTAQSNVLTVESFLAGNGFTRGLGHIAFPEGATNDTVNAMLESNGFKTGRKATDKLQIVPPADFYKLECYTLKNTDTLATAKGYVDSAIESGKSAIIMIEGLADSDPTEQEWLTSDYTDLISYIKEKENQGLIDEPPTISEWYNGLSGTDNYAISDPISVRYAKKVNLEFERDADSSGSSVFYVQASIDGKDGGDFIPAVNMVKNSPNNHSQYIQRQQSAEIQGTDKKEIYSLDLKNFCYDYIQIKSFSDTEATNTTKILIKE